MILQLVSRIITEFTPICPTLPKVYTQTTATEGTKYFFGRGGGHQVTHFLKVKYYSALQVHSAVSASGTRKDDTQITAVVPLCTLRFWPACEARPKLGRPSGKGLGANSAGFHGNLTSLHAPPLIIKVVRRHCVVSSPSDSL